MRTHQLQGQIPSDMPRQDSTRQDPSFSGFPPLLRTDETSSSHAIEADQGQGKRKRPRLKSSCLQCQKRKIRCDQEDPCGACQKKGCVDECNFEVPDISLSHENLLADMVAVKRRLSKLEKRLSTALTEEGKDEGRWQQNLKERAWESRDSKAGSEAGKSASVPVPSILSEPEGSLQTASFYDPSDDAHGNSYPHNCNIDRETQSAVAAIESMAFDHEQFPVLGISAPIPFNGRSGAGVHVHRQILPLLRPGSYTTIFIPQKHQFDSEQSIFRTREVTDPLLASLPDEDLSKALVDFFFEELCWLYDVFHRPTFLDECSQLFGNVAVQQSKKRVDPAWLACYYMNHRYLAGQPCS